MRTIFLLLGISLLTLLSACQKEDNAYKKHKKDKECVPCMTEYRDFENPDDPLSGRVNTANVTIKEPLQLNEEGTYYIAGKVEYQYSGDEKPSVYVEYFLKDGIHQGIKKTLIMDFCLCGDCSDGDDDDYDCCIFVQEPKL